jgi:uncharacterized damage-inducible protein DinB
MARYNATANHRLLSACAQLSAEEFAAVGVSFFPSLQATLNHILIVDWFYIDALESGTLGEEAFRDRIPHPGFAALDAAQRRSDQQLVDFCDRLDEASLAATLRLPRSRPVPLETVADVLMHLFLHQTHHRGQAHAMLSGTSVKPPQLDEFFLAEDAGYREADLRAVGLTQPF